MGDSQQDPLVTLQIGQAVMNEKLNNITVDVAAKHVQNRSSIHDLGEKMQEIVDEVWKLKVKIAAYSAVAGVITTLVIKVVDHYIK